jgi:PAS domain S-box-containing protein
MMMNSHISREANLSRRNTRNVRVTVREKIAVAKLARELSHELNNPLEALVNLIYIARQRALDDETRALLDEAESQLGRMSVVVHSILTLEQSSHEQRLSTAGTLLDPPAFQRIKEEYESALHLASIIDGAQDAIYSKKLDGTIMAWNAGAERLFGYPAKEALGKSVMMLVPPDLSQEERGIFEKIRTGTRVEHFDTLRRTKDGKDIRVSVSISPIRNPRGRVVGASTIAREVTEKHWE